MSNYVKQGAQKATENNRIDSIKPINAYISRNTQDKNIITQQTALTILKRSSRGCLSKLQLPNQHTNRAIHT